MATKYQLIPFPVNAYLATYLANKLKQSITNIDGLDTIEVDRFSGFGKLIMRSIEESPIPVNNRNDSIIYLKISCHSGDHYDIPRGKLHFLKINKKALKNLTTIIKDDFDASLTSFVDGAEFAHKLNGWTPDKKRKGIRKKAIVQFCQKHQVTFSELNLESFVKLVQRALKSPEQTANKAIKKYCESLSY